MKRLALLLLLLFLPVPSLQPAAAQKGHKPRHTAPRSVTVYITRTGKKYHQDGCRYLRKSRIAITIKDALQQGYSACSVCAPPGK
jgi:hypothetical protein